MIPTKPVDPRDSRICDGCGSLSPTLVHIYCVNYCPRCYRVLEEELAATQDKNELASFGNANTDYEQVRRRNNLIDIVVTAVCAVIFVGIILLSTAEGCIIFCN